MKGILHLWKQLKLEGRLLLLTILLNQEKGENFLAS